MRYSGIGGQAVMEGVMMKNQEAVTGRYKDDDSQYSLKNLLMRQEKEAHHED